MIYRNFKELVGNTPLFELNNIEVSKKEENKNIVIIFPDGLNRYTSLLK